jgi:hypothetical protein
MNTYPRRSMLFVLSKTQKVKKGWPLLGAADIATVVATVVGGLLAAGILIIVFVWAMGGEGPLP